MTALAQTLELARAGLSPAQIATQLNVPLDLAEAMVQHWVRLGELGELRPAPACDAVACAGCFFAEICEQPGRSR